MTLRSPPPLGRALSVERDGGRVRIRDGETLVAEGGPADVEVQLPAAVSVGAARAASARYPGFRAHAYATCFVCGPDRNDGLGIYPGPVDGRDVVAAAWAPERGPVRDEIVWAALDCPSGWAIDTFGREGVLLGRLAARILERPRGGEPHVVLGWPLGAGGRKRLAGSALLRADGEPLAVARSTWIVPRPA